MEITAVWLGLKDWLWIKIYNANSYQSPPTLAHSMGKFNNRRKHSGLRGSDGGGRGRPYHKPGRGRGRGRGASWTCAEPQPPPPAAANGRLAPLPAAWQPESESEEEPTALDEVLQLVGGRRRRAVAVESDEEDSEEEVEQSGGEEEDAVVCAEDRQDEDGAGSVVKEDDGESGDDVESDKVGAEEADSALEDEAMSDDDALVEEDSKADARDAEDAPTTPFAQHFEQNLPEPVGESLQTATRWQSERQRWPRLGALIVQHRPVEAAGALLSAVQQAEHVRLFSSPVFGRHEHPEGYGVRQQIASNVAVLNEKLFSRPLTELQQEVLSLISEYRDLYFPHRTLQNEDELRVVYCAHALSHVLRTRSRIVHHNSKVSKKDDVPDSYRDQGLTRPKVLIVVPFKHSAFRIVNTLISLLQSAGKSSVMRYKRFAADFGDGDAPPPAPGRLRRPPDFLATFAGNTDDAFRLGLQVTKKSMRLYSDFYHSDVIVTSPLGLRTVLGSEGESDRDVDFLNSIELLIMDQTDVFLNWEHVLHLVEHLHLQPRDSHGVDFSRVRYWTLNGWQRLYRQTLVLSALPTPEINALVSKCCLNYAGRVLVQNPEVVGSIQQVVVQVPQAFHRFSAESLASEPDVRFQFFVEKVLPQHRDVQMNQTLLLVPSYFDYVRIRNHFIKETVNFVQVCEYTKDSRVSRARDMFYHGKRHFLLYTERFHFFRRYRIKGIRHVVFYGLPVYPHLYSEICNLMQEAYQNPRTAQDGAGVTCTVLFSRFDRLKLARVVGAERATSMIGSEKQVHMFVTGES
ncbi:digestive organ expansion factor homolog isoform X2 [Pollicipes pollicipes]|uniref:digestive organ expansion factor homolog isoform X2 n=1 Tax=Pollicipes pollicipes TaxID=41117 RepID=UPI001884EFF5|nr:digestive organ expansion factor homolog isoform X2 [Pollicipes pollicipes]